MCVLRVLPDAFPLVVLLQLPQDRHRHRGQRDKVGMLMDIGRLPFPELERYGPEPGVEVDAGRQHVQDFPATLRGQEPEFELLSDERASGRREFIFSTCATRV
jgi:hypothetical protein